MDPFPFSYQLRFQIELGFVITSDAGDALGMSRTKYHVLSSEAEFRRGSYRDHTTLYHHLRHQKFRRLVTVTSARPTAKSWQYQSLSLLSGQAVFSDL